MQVSYGLLLVTCQLSLVTVAWAAKEPVRLEEVVVTATKGRLPERKVTRAVSVVGESELHERAGQGRLLHEGLRGVPGALVRRTGAIGRTTATVLRGSQAKQVQVLLDGANVASPTTGEFNFSHLSIDNIERAEVMRGPGSVLYGSDAMAGVINIRTKRGEGPTRFTFRQEVGTMRTLREELGLTRGEGPWHLSSAISHVDSRGHSDNDQYGNLNFSTRLGYDLDEHSQIDVSVRQVNAIVGLDDGAFRPDANRRLRDRMNVVTIQGEFQPRFWWQSTVHGSTLIGYLLDQDPSDRGGNADTAFRLDTERYHTEWVNRFTPAPWNTVTVGVEFEDREADNRTIRKTRTVFAGYLHDQLSLWERVEVAGGIRWLRESEFCGWDVVEASTAYLIPEWAMKVRGGYGEGFRAPTLNELFFPNFGNPNLGPEKSQSFEVGMDQDLFEGAAGWSATYFWTDYEDLIQAVRTSATASEARNIGQAEIHGLETEFTAQPFSTLTLRGTYTHMEASERPSGEELVRTPKNLASWSLRWAPLKPWELLLDGLLVGSREEQVATNKREKIERYIKWNLAVSYQVNAQASVYGRVENLTSRQYSEVLGFPAEGALFTVGSKVEL